MRITHADQLAHCSPAVRRQLEAHFDDDGQAKDTLAIEPTGERTAEAKGKKRLNRPEQDAGKMLVDWIDRLVLANGLRPGEFFAHVPNGGFRDAVEAAIFYGQGVRKSWPDYMLMLPRHGYHGLVLELKAPEGGTPDADQLAALERLESVGYKACVAWGFDDARRSISRYLDLDG